MKPIKLSISAMIFDDRRREKFEPRPTVPKAFGKGSRFRRGGLSYGG